MRDIEIPEEIVERALAYLKLRRWLDATGGEIKAKRSYRVNSFWGRTTMLSDSLWRGDILTGLAKHLPPA
jgi:hypothetical protein